MRNWIRLGVVFVGAWGSEGSGEGEFQSPIYVAIADSGNIYVSDWGNYRMQVFSDDFEFIEEWVLFGDEEPHFRIPSGIDFDAEGNVLVAVSGIGRVQKYSPTHDFITQWGISPTAPGQFNNPFDIDVDSEGNIFVADTHNRRIQKFNRFGIFLTEWDIPYDDVDLPYPNGIAIDSDGYVYVLDQYYEQVYKFDNNGNWDDDWGLAEGILQEDDFPTGIAISEDGYLYVAGGFSSNIHKFTTVDGSFELEWGGEGLIDYPYAVAVDGDGDVYVIDADNYLILKFDHEGNLITQWGGEGNEDGLFISPTALAIDQDGYVYVLDANLGNITIQAFTPEGDFVSRWHNNQLEDVEQLNSPRGMVIDANGKIFITDTFNQRIQVLAPSLPDEDPETGLILNGNFGSAGNASGSMAWHDQAMTNDGLVRGMNLRTIDGLDYWTYGGSLPIARTVGIGGYSLRLGESVNPVEQGLGTAWASQVFYIPPGAEAELSLNVRIFTNDNINRADFLVEIQDAVALNNLAVVTRMGYETDVVGERPQGTVDLGWETIQYDLSAFSGRFVRILLSNRHLTQDSFGIWTYVENVSVIADYQSLPDLNHYFLPLIMH